MRILILSFYFYPDLSAGSFRTTALVDELSQRVGADAEIDVLTTVPNRYQGFDAEASAERKWANVRVRRVPLPQHRSGMVDQSRAFVAYAQAVRQELRGKRYDVVFATSSRLMTAVLGTWVAQRRRSPLYLDIRDIFPDTLGDLFAGKPQRGVVPAFRMLERWAISKADRVNLVSPGFADYFSRIRPEFDFRFFTNGIDEAFIGPDFARRSRSGDATTILYAGNIGEGQGLERIVPAAASLLGDGYRFRIVGAGGTLPRLQEALVNDSIGNVELVPPVQRDELLREYADADVLFLHLNDHAAFEKVLPSKVFEYGATGKPVLAGVAGYAGAFVRENVRNSAVFSPCDAEGLVGALKTLKLETAPRHEFVERFARTAIIERMAEDILDLAEAPSSELSPSSHQRDSRA